MHLVSAGYDEPVLSVIMVNHGHGESAIKAVQSVLSLKDRVTIEIIFIDNSLTDGAADWLEKNVPNIRLIQNNSIKGFAHNCNTGMRAARGSGYIVLMNPDVQCLPGVFDELVKFMEVHNDVGIAGPKLLNLDGTPQMSTRRFLTPLMMIIRALHLNVILRKMNFVREYLMSDFDHMQIADVDWVTGAFVIIRRKAITQVGLMDERYFLYAEDQDWCCRMWRGGWRVCYVPHAQAIHAHLQEGFKKPWSKAARHLLVSAIRMFWKFGGKLSRHSR